MKFKEFAEIEALVGQTFGKGKDARTITRITNIHEGTVPGAGGTVYWKRPGGKERRVGKYLPHFIQWIEEQDKKSNRSAIQSVLDVEEFLSDITPSEELVGFTERVGNKVNIQFEIKPCSENTNT